MPLFQPTSRADEGQDLVPWKRLVAQTERIAMQVHLLIQKRGGARVPIAVYSNAERALAAGADVAELVSKRRKSS